MALRLDENDTDSRLNPGQADYDQKFNGETKNSDNPNSGEGNDSTGQLSDAEQAAAKGGANQSQSLGDQEDSNTGFNSSFTGKNNRNPVKGRFNLRKSGPVGAIIGILGIGGFGLATLFSPSLLLVHIEESFVNKFNTQDTSFTIRTNKIIAKKLTSDTTSGICGGAIPVNIACKYQRPSNKLLSQLNKNDIKAFGPDGEIKPTKLGWPNQRPTSFEFTDSAGNKLSVEASKFYDTLSNNAEFRAAVHKSFNTRFMNLTDSISMKVLKLFGVDITNKLSNAKSEADVDSNLNKSVGGLDSEGNPIANGAADAEQAAIDEFTREAEKAAEKEANKVKAKGGANAVMISANLACMATDIPQIVIDVERGAQLPQLIRLASAMLTTAGAIKAGDATPEQVSAFGNQITKVVKNKSAMDSFGMKYALFGDVASNKDTNYQKFIPGGSAINQLGGLATTFKKPAVTDSCKIITSQTTQVAVDAIMMDTGIPGLVNFVGGELINLAGAQIAQIMVSGAISLLQSSGLMTKIMEGMLGNIAQNAFSTGGEDLGDAIASGGANLMGQVSNAGYNMPMTVSQAVAYDQTTKQVQLAYAQEDQATLSPFDASSSNTFLGSLFNKLLPFTTQTGSFGDILGSITGIVASIPSGILPSVYAADPAAQYSGCTDPSLAGDGSGNSIAVGPFCNIQYGIPTQYLNRDPVDVLNGLISSNQVDSISGEPVSGSDLENWINSCTDGSASGAASCAITDDTHANYALYMMDHRIQKDLDGEDTTTTTSSSGTAAVSNSQLYQSSVNTACAAGTTDAGVAQGYYNGQEIDIRLCSIPGTVDSGDSSQPIQVNSVMSANFLALTQAMGQALGSPVKAASSFRTMAAQQMAYASYGSSRAAKPGYSNHQMGLAVDFQLATGNNGSTKPAGTDRVYDWLVANAAKYDISQLSIEAWHWQAAGAS